MEVDKFFEKEIIYKYFFQTAKLFQLRGYAAVRVIKMDVNKLFIICS